MSKRRPDYQSGFHLKGDEMATGGPSLPPAGGEGEVEREVGSVPVVRFELEYADGRIRRLLGEDATAWKNWLDGAAAMACNHGCAPRPVVWIDIPPPLGEPRGKTEQLAVDDSPPRMLVGVDFGKESSRTVIAGAVEKLELYGEGEETAPRGEKLECACGWEGTVLSGKPCHTTCPRCGVLVF